MMKRHVIIRFGIPIVCLVTVTIAYAFCRRVALIAQYQFVLSQDRLELLRAVPQVEVLEQGRDWSNDSFLGYASFDSSIDSLKQISATRFPKIALAFESMTITLHPVTSYGLSVYDDCHLEKAEVVMQAADPYTFAKECCMAVPESLVSILCKPLAELRRDLMWFRRKSNLSAMPVFFESDSKKAVYTPRMSSSNGLGSLVIYDTERCLQQFALISDIRGSRSQEAIKDFISSFQFTVGSVPEEREELHSMLLSALRRNKKFVAETLEVN